MDGCVDTEVRTGRKEVWRKEEEFNGCREKGHKVGCCVRRKLLKGREKMEGVIK